MSDERLEDALLREMRAHALAASDSGFTRVEIDPLHLAEIIERAVARPLVLAGETPAWVEELAASWEEEAQDEREDCEEGIALRMEQCAAELRARARARAKPLVMPPAEPQPDAPTDIAALPDFWDERRRRQGKPDLSRCAAELRIALRAKGGEHG